MTFFPAPKNAEVLKHRAFDLADLRALRASRRGRICLLLEVNASRLNALLGTDDEGERVRCSQYDSEAELFRAFDRAAVALAR